MQLYFNYVMVFITMGFVAYVTYMYLESSKEDSKLIIGKLLILMFAGLGHASIMLSPLKSDNSYKIIGLTIILFLLFTVMSHFIGYLEPLVWHIVCFLHLVGSVMLHRLNSDLCLKQNQIAILGFLVMIVVGYLVNNIDFLDKITYIYIILAIAMLLISNTTANGATNWFEFKGFSFQPSEFVKIIFAFYLASFFKRKYTFWNLVLGSGLSAILVLILVYQKDLGSAFLFFALYVVVSYMYSQKRWLPFLQFGALAAGGIIAYKLFDHVRIRVLAWADPFSYVEDEGYQIAQGLFAFANGKWMGVGLTNGSPDKIPVVSSDFIFAAIGEEFGSVFSILLVLLYLLLIIMLVSQCQKSKSLFNAYVGIGLVVMFGFQGFLIIGGVIKLIPMTGVTLPFISYGGTSLIATIVSLGIIEAITKNNNQSKKRKYREHTLITVKLMMTGLYMLLIGYFVFILVVQSDAIRLNSYNPRLQQIEETIHRGSIYDSTGKVLAYSVLEKDGWARKYPYNNMFTHVVGYSQVGKTGIEAALNEELLNGHYSLFNQMKRLFLVEPVVGSDVYLTLDYKLQKIAYDALNGKKGAVVAMEPTTGKILAMVSKPDFDPNQIENIYQDLLEDQNGVLLNRVTNGLYPPGSTFKLVTALAYVHQFGDDFDYVCHGVDVFSNKYIHCYGNTAHGRVNIKEAFAMSCNTAFATMGEKLDLVELKELANQLLFNQPLPYDYNYHTSSYVMNERASDELRAETVIGQGETLITPLHNLLITSAVANGGQLMKPYLVDKIVNSEGKIIKKNIPETGSMLLTIEDTKRLKSYMESVIEEGTGHKIKNENYTAAGKTGAAENPFGDTHAWFIGFAPANNPEIAVAIIVENAGSSNANSVPIAKKMFDYYLTERLN